MAEKQDRKSLNRTLELIAGKENKMQAYCEFIMDCGRGLSRCNGCWLQVTHCACSSWVSVESSIKVVVHVHHGDWVKASNTGVCIHRTLPGSELLLKGFKEHDSRLIEILEDKSTIKCVLWPGEDAISVEEFKDLAAKSNANKIVVIAPDGSYRGARKMASKYPRETPRVRLSSKSVLGSKKVCMMTAVRRYAGDQSKTGRVSTLEAVAAFLKEMGEEEVVTDALHGNMKVKLDMVRLQAGRETLYGSQNAAQQ